MPGSCPRTKIALLLKTVADKSTRIQWLPSLDIFFLSLQVLNLFLRSILNCKRCLESKSDTLSVTVYSKYLEQISVHVLTDIHNSRKQGKSVPLQDIQAGKKRQEERVKGQGSKTEGYSTRHPASCTEACTESHSAPLHSLRPPTLPP